jgi:hypothetical protein
VSDAPDTPRSQESGAGGALPRGVSVEALAERVYRLMREELRLERIRGGAEPATRR